MKDAKHLYELSIVINGEMHNEREFLDAHAAHVGVAIGIGRRLGVESTNHGHGETSYVASDSPAPHFFPRLLYIIKAQKRIGLETKKTVEIFRKSLQESSVYTERQKQDL